MNVNFGSYTPLSTIDDFGFSSVVIFLRGCILDCWYCHNKAIASGEDIRDVKFVKELIKSSFPFVSSVTFSGGEPLLQVDAVEELIDYTKKELNLQVCLYTSGNYPEALGQVANKIDRCYIDFKLDDIGVHNTLYVRNALESIKILQQAKVQTFITVVVFDTAADVVDDIEYIKRITGKNLIVIQGVIGKTRPLTPDEMKAAFKTCYIRTRENGVEWND